MRSEDKVFEADLGRIGGRSRVKLLSIEVESSFLPLKQAQAVLLYTESHAEAWNFYRRLVPELRMFTLPAPRSAAEDTATLATFKISL